MFCSNIFCFTSNHGYSPTSFHHVRVDGDNSVLRFMHAERSLLSVFLLDLQERKKIEMFRAIEKIWCDQTGRFVEGL